MVTIISADTGILLPLTGLLWGEKRMEEKKR